MMGSKHSTVVAYLALFVALGGTAYAATGGNFLLGHVNRADAPSTLTNTGTGPALRLTTHNGSTAPFTVSNGTKITRLNADSVDGLGASAFQRAPLAISTSTTSPNTVAVGSFGPWALSLKCSSVGSATIKITGPGEAGGTTSRSANNTAGNTFVAPMQAIGAGYVAIADTDEQVSWRVFLRSGATRGALDILLTANNGGSFENCGVIGAASVISG